jgi:ribosomal protein S12 methylthiotransferase accessory factor
MQAANLPAARLKDHLHAEAALLRSRGPSEDHSDRIDPARETVARMRRDFPRFGITRLADVTGLDRIGIPVWMAIRPNSKTLAVSQGKGLSDAAAQASAIMEAAEIAIAENAPTAKRFASLQELTAEGLCALPLNNLVARGEPLVGESETIAWVEGYDLLKESTVWVPAEAVSLDPLDERGRLSRFWQSSDGLASGNILLEAVVHGLCERVERDAGTLWLFRSDEEMLKHCIDPASLEDSAVDSLAAQIARAGFQLRLFDITSDVGVPVHFAVIAPALDGFETHWKHFDLSSGMGCHPSPARAAIRAITEAAQSRVTSITGARDDFDPNLYRTQLRSDLTDYLRAAPTGRATPQAQRTDVMDNLEFILSRLRKRSIGSVIVIPFEAGEPGFAVAKVVVPELENPVGNRRQRYGRRAIAAMAGLQ